MKKNNLHFVFDANAIVSASLFENSTSAKAFNLALDHAIILLSETTLREIQNVLNREKFDRYVSKTKRQKFLRVLVRDAELIDTIVKIRECRDPDDDNILNWL